MPLGLGLKQRVITSGGSPWTPATFGTDLGFWIEGSATTGTSPVTAWPDQGPHGNNWTASNSPTVITGINSLPCVQFVAASSQSFSATATSTLEPTAAMAVGCVFQKTSNAGSFYNLLAHANSALNVGYFFGNGPAGLAAQLEFAANSYASDYGGGSVGLTNGTPISALGVYDGANVTLYLSGTQSGTISPQTAAISYSGVNAPNIGDAPGCNPFDGLIGEMFMLQRAPTSGERASWFAYTLSKWGV